MRALAIVAALITAQPGQSAPVADRKMAELAARLFPDLVAIDTGKLPKATRTMLSARRVRMNACGEVAACQIKAAMWSDAERAGIAQGTASSVKEPSLEIPTRSDRIDREINGINSLLSVYGTGLPSRYPAIDGPADVEGSPQFAARVAEAVALAAVYRDDPSGAFDPSVGLALSLLDANDRDDAAAFEPLDAKLNAAALVRAGKTDWARYRYGAIIVPGIGPDDLATPLSARGKLNVRLAAQRFADGLAPFIIVTGASVHPRGSTTIEAIEMQRALIDRYGVPADCIVVEPYARHTTTNLRNVTRRLMALRAPLDRDVLIVTNPAQSQYIASPDFVARSMRDLGYMPGTVGIRISPTDLTFRPSPRSALIDPMDPLDP